MRYHGVTAFLSGEPRAVSLPWWYIGSCLSAVCLCHVWMWRMVLEWSLLTSVIILVSLCEPVVEKGTTNPSLPTCHGEEKEAKAETHNVTFKNCHRVTNTQD